MIKKNIINRMWRIKNSHNKTQMYRKYPFDKIKVGKHTYGVINAFYYLHPEESISIGNYVSIADGVEFISGGEHYYEGLTTYPIKVFNFNHQHESLTKGPIKVNDGVWIGKNSCILSGVSIGTGSIIAAGSVVVNDVEPFSIYGGNPARFIKKIHSKDIIEKISEIGLVTLIEAVSKEDLEYVYSSEKELRRWLDEFQI